MNENKEVKLYTTSDFDEYLQIGPWVEVPGFVEIELYKVSDTRERDVQLVSYPTLNREQFEELVKATRYVMGWENE